MEKQRTGGELMLILALCLGVLGDILFRNAGCGLNITVWMFAVFGTVLVIRRQQQFPPLSGWIWVAVALSPLAIYRDAFTLKLITTIAMLGAVSYATISTERSVQLKQTVFTYLGRMVDTLLAGLQIVTHYIPPHVSVSERIPSTMTMSILRGSAIASIALLLFGSLLVSADAMFEKLVVSFFDLGTIFTHVGLVFVFAWLGCTLLFVLSVGPASVASRTRSDLDSGGYAIEVNIVLATVNALFITFVYVQASYFFGGHERVMEEAGLTYAQYARRGFFEIAAVAVLAFAMVLICDELIPTAKSMGRRGFNGLMTLHIGLVGVLIASAFHRLTMYIEAYGLTELRFYVATCILWIAMAFVLLGAAVLSRQRFLLPRILVATLFIAVVALHVINPASIVVRTNLTRESVQQRFDVEYALSMSADAVPTLTAGLANLTEAQRAEVEAALLQRWITEIEPEYRDWNYSRWRAAQVVRQQLSNSNAS